MRTQPTEGTPPSPDKPKAFRGAVVHRRRGAVLLTVLAMAAALAGCASPRPGAPSPASTVAHQLARSGATSVIVFVSDHGHRVVAIAGTPRPAAGQRFRVASVTKTFTATLVLQLVDQKRIGLADPVGRYLPGVIPAEARSPSANFSSTAQAWPISPTTPPGWARPRNRRLSGRSTRCGSRQPSPCSSSREASGTIPTPTTLRSGSSSRR